MLSASARVPSALTGLALGQLDALREVANIGAGHAATALSDMTGRRVDIGVPNVSLAAMGALTDIIGKGCAPLVLTRVRASGAFSGGVAIAFGEPAARNLTNLLLGRASSGANWLDGLGASALKEVGNVLGAAYLNALAGLTGWTIPISTPDIVCARADWAISLLGVDEQDHDYAICLETSFSVDGAPDEVSGHVLLFPRHDLVHSLLEVIGAA